MTKFVKTYNLYRLKARKLSLGLLLGVGVISQGIPSVLAIQLVGGQNPYSA